VEEFTEKRPVARNTCKKEKRKWENEWLLEIKNDFNKKQTRKYYKEVEDIKAGFQPRISFCRDKEGKLIADRGKITDSG
jgi:hypothetical protein